MPSNGAPDTEHDASLSETTLAALGLRRQPFADEADGDERFVDEVATEQLGDVRRALIDGDDLLLILGERGAGKSVLLEQLLAHSGLRIQCFPVRGGPRFGVEKLFGGMLEAFKVRPPGDLRAMLDELIPCLQAMIGNNTLSVVVLDDAHEVPAGELTKLLGSLLYVNSRDESLLRVALAAPPGFEERLPELLPEGADLPYSSLVLEPFDAARAAAYVDFRLERAGLVGELPFDEREMRALNERAGGLPGALHAVVADALGAAHDPSHVPRSTAEGDGDEVPPELLERRRGGSSGLRFVLGTLAALMIVGGLLLFLRDDGPDGGADDLRVAERRELFAEGEESEGAAGANDAPQTATVTDAGERSAENAAEGDTDTPEDDASTLATADPAEPGPDSDPAAGSIDAADDGGERSPTASAERSAPSGDGAGDEATAGAAVASAADPAAEDPIADAQTPETTASTEAPSAAEVPTEGDGTTVAAADTPGPTSAALTDADDGPARADTSGTDEEAASADEETPTDATAAADDGETVADDEAVAAAETAGTTGEAADAAEVAATDEDVETDASAQTAGERPDDGDGTTVATLDTGDERAPEGVPAEEEEDAPAAARPSPVAETAAPVAGALESPNWVLVQNPDQYTVQMSASTDRASVEEFLESTQLEPPNSIFSFERNGRTWYALVHGLYPSIDEARAAIERMPEPALVHQPWIRSIRRVQSSLRR